MGKVNKFGLVTCFVSAVMLSGCGGANAGSHATAEAVIGSIFARSAGSEEKLAMLKSMPEYEQAVDCMANELDQQGWTDEQHEFFMEETNQTGSLDQINQRKFSETDLIAHFGPILTIPNSCM